MESAIPGWLALARRLGGTLERGDGSVRGEHGGMPVEITHDWTPQGPSHGTLVKLAITPPLEEEPDPERLDAEARSLVERIGGAETRQLVVGREAIEVRLASPVELDAMLPMLDQMAALALAVRPKVGPYR